ncbi:tetratricopeptide repeat protein [Lentimicrobium sp.]|mgnify:FL=1|uniref:tetratricopeptide repeat protein n=1 Tax=Lentimicrobium sp. TaxID=2034841 RepID=UPI002D078CE4|nr:tetratricopeptide repeat protein [Lentimicrobium sp.]HRW70244.1 tetratricopeptide repeat protein [Lentimicrobium sp.]
MKKLFILLCIVSLVLFRIPVSAQAVTDEQLGLMYYNNKEFDKAAALFDRLFGEKPNLFNYTYLIQSLLELNDFDQAEKIVKKQARRFPDDARYVVDQGYLLLRTNQGNKAAKIFEQAIKDLPAEQRKVAELANSFISRRENDYAIRTYLKGRQMLAPQYTFGFELSNLYEISGNFDKMAEEYLGLLETNPEFQNQVQARLQNSLNNDPEGLKSEAFRTALLRKVQSNPDDVMMSEMMLWLSIQLKDFETALIQARALDRRLDENGSRVFALGGLSVNNGNYKTGAEAYQYVIDRSSDMGLVVQSKVELLRADYEQLIRTYPLSLPALKNLEQRYVKTLDEANRNPLSFPLMRNLAHLQAFYLDNTEGAIQLLDELISLTNNNKLLQAECKLELADIMLFTGDPWEATLLYSQVDKAFKNEPIGHEARFRNAKLSFYIGEFNWARAQLDVLKAATSKLIANDAMAMSLIISDNIDMDSSTVQLGTYARADLLLYRNQPDAAIAVLDSLLQAWPEHLITDEALMKKAEIRMKQGMFSEAETLYKQVISEYGEGIQGDDAQFRLGLLYEEQMKDNTKAMAAYQEMLVKYPGSVFSVEARKRFRLLRGDMVN